MRVRIAWFCTVVGLAAALARPSSAQQPTGVEIRPEAGPWLICVQSFIGPSAAELARDMTIELRGKPFELPAYSFDRSAEQRKKQDDYAESLRKRHFEDMQRHGLTPDPKFRVKVEKIPPSSAVLVGGWKTMDEASKYLNHLRDTFKKNEKKPFPLSKKFMNLESLRNGDQVDQVYLSPFVTAYVVHNPTVSVEKEDPNKPDPYLKELNADESFSLLKNRKSWTLVIKQIQGPVAIQAGGRQKENRGFLDNIGLGKNSTEIASASMLQAHSLAELLRKQFNLDAYVLHTRYASLVTVGGFDSVDDPKLVAMQAHLSKIQLQPQNPELSEYFRLMKPMPMAIPRP